MTVGERLRKLRKDRDMTQRQLADKIGCSHQTISKYEDNGTLWRLDTITKISEFFNISTDYLINGTMSVDNHALSVEEEYILDQYKGLSSHDKEIVDFILGVNSPKTRITKIVQTDNVIYLPVFEQKASAGIGESTNDVSNNINITCFPIDKVPSNVTHGVIIEGSSMQPMFLNGQIVFINIDKKCNIGDYGIFNVIINDRAEAYCKQLKSDSQGRLYLHSVNPKSKDPEFYESDDVRIECIGKIIIK